MRATDTRAVVRFGPILAILCFVTAVLYPLILLGRALYFGDLILYFYPLEHLIQRSLHDGSIPLWNPWMVNGQPVVGNPQASVFYPSTLLLTFLPVWLYFTVNTFIHLALGGWGSYLYLRRITADRLSAILGATVFAGSGFLIARLQFPTIIQTAAWFPWLLLAVDRIIERPSARYGAGFACVSALTILAGHAQIAYMSFACAGVYAIARLIQIRNHRPRVRRAILELVGFLALGVMIASVQLLPMIELFGRSTHEHLELKEANRFVLLPEQLVNFVTPNWFGNPQMGDYWGSGNYWEPCVYVGLLPLALGAYALTRGLRRRAIRFFAFLGAVALWLSLGRYGGLFFLAYYIVPGIASFHDPARFNFVTTFAIAVLAAAGLRRLRDVGIANQWRVAITALAAAQLAWFGAGLNPTVRPASLDYAPPKAADLPGPGEGRTFYAFGPDTWKRYASYQDYGSQSDGHVREIARTLLPNIGIGLGFEEVNSYEPVPIRTAWEANGLAHDAIQRHDPAVTERMNLVNARSLLLPGGMRYHHPGLQRSLRDSSIGYESRNPQPRAWLAQDWQRVDGSQRALNAVATPGYDARVRAAIGGDALKPYVYDATKDRDKPIVTYGHPAPDPRFVRITRQGPGEAAFEVECAWTSGLLLWSQASYPGWTATVDWQPAKVSTVDSAFLGVSLPAGWHTVQLRFEPFSYKLGLYLTAVALAVIAGALFAGGRARGFDRSSANLIA